jgi:REP-associated tyrosine transposase
MARPLRLEFPGAVYHVMARGLERGSLFRDVGDRHSFFGLLGRITEDEGWETHAYCLMSNHYHLLIETPHGSLSRGMHMLNARYSQRFNRAHDRRGHFFEGRFRSILVQKESHLLELHRYIVLNPVRAKLADRAGDWKWSSYRATAGIDEAPVWLETDWTLSQFGRGRAAARKAFARFVAEGRDSGREIEEIERKGYVGDQDFGKSIRRRLEGKDIPDEIPLRFRTARPEVSLDEVRRAVSKEWGVAEPALSRRRGGDEKKAAIYLARKLTREGGREIGAAFGVKAAWVSNIVVRLDAEPESGLARRIEKVRRRLTERASGR